MHGWSNEWIKQLTYKNVEFVPNFNTATLGYIWYNFVQRLSTTYILSKQNKLRVCNHELVLMAYPVIHYLCYTALVTILYQYLQPEIKSSRNSWYDNSTVQGWGLLKLRSLISPQAKFSILQTYLLDCLNHIYIWQVPPQPSCGDTCQI